MPLDLTTKTSPLLLSSSAEAEVDHEVERRVEDRQQVVDADQDEGPLQTRNKKS